MQAYSLRDQKEFNIGVNKESEDSIINNIFWNTAHEIKGNLILQTKESRNSILTQICYYAHMSQ